MTTPRQTAVEFRTTDDLHSPRVKHRLERVPAMLECWSGMPRRRKAPGKDAVECILRVVTKDGRTTIEIELEDEQAAVKLAAKLLRANR